MACQDKIVTIPGKARSSSPRTDDERHFLTMSVVIANENDHERARFRRLVLLARAMHRPASHERSLGTVPCNVGRERAVFNSPTGPV